MSEFNTNDEINKNNEFQSLINKYSASIEQIALQFESADSEEYPVHETPQFDIQEVDGSPIKISFAYYPNGQEYFPGVKNATIIETESPGTGKWIKNYHIYDDTNGNLTWEKSEWFITSAENRETLENGDDAVTLSDEMNERTERIADLNLMNLADKKAYIAEMSEQLAKPNIETPTGNELSLLQYYVDQLI